MALPHRDLLSPAQRIQILALPNSLGEIEGLYTLTAADKAFIARHRTNSNRLGLALQLCFLRYPGRAWTVEDVPPASMARFIAQQVGVSPMDLSGYAARDQTRREHFVELLKEYGWRSFALHDYRELSAWLSEQARSTDQGLALVTLLIAEIRRRRMVVPRLPVLERLALSSRARARAEAYASLTTDLTIEERMRLDWPGRR